MRTNERLLILGSTGLIGSACVRYCRRNNITDMLLPTHTELELTNATQVKQYFQRHRPDSVILAAGKVGGIIANKTTPANFITQNLMIQLNVFQAAINAKVKKLIFFGSSCMYPRKCAQPMTEEMLLTGPIEPTSASYAMAKLAGIQLCRAYNEQYRETQFIALIPNSTYGPNDNFDPDSAHVLSALIRRFHEAKMSQAKQLVLWGTGQVRREFVHAGDVANAVFTVLQHDGNIPLPLNVGVGQDYSISELAASIQQVVGFQGKILWDTSKPDGVPQKLLDNTKILSLGWRPKIDLTTGIQKTVQWFLENYAHEYHYTSV